MINNQSIPNTYVTDAIFYSFLCKNWAVTLSWVCLSSVFFCITMLTC